MIPASARDTRAVHRPRPLRLLHFDINTVHQYGDQLLFECVRQVFNGFGGGDYFDLTNTFPLRQRVTRELIERINDEYDGVVVGGGGLFLKSTNVNPRSGWQWDISLDSLRQLKKPIIVFGVGYNRFYGQDEFEPIFAKHIAEVIRHSVFFGLRNSGSVDAIRSYLASDLAEQVSLQPCPTSFSRYLFPDLVTPEPSPRQLGLQIGLGPPHSSGGFTPELLFPRLARIVHQLQADGWDVNIVAHRSADMAFTREYGDLLQREPAQLFGSPDVLFTGLSVYSRLHIVLGGRGHAQLIPFGLGNVPLSIRLAPKLEYFARDVNHLEWIIDPFADDFEDLVCRAVSSAGENWQLLHDDIYRHNSQFFELTLDNLAAIYERITGIQPERSFLPYSARERRFATATYAEHHRRLQVEARGRRRAATLSSELHSAREAENAAATDRDDAVAQLIAIRRRTEPERMLRKADELARAGQIASARRALAAVEYLSPGSLTRGRQPRWARSPWRFVPSVVLSAAVRFRCATARITRRELAAGSRSSSHPPQ
jgi:hypothetical protein